MLLFEGAESDEVTDFEKHSAYKLLVCTVGGSHLGLVIYLDCQNALKNGDYGQGKHFHII